MHFVTAQEIEPHRSVSIRIEEQVDRPAKLDAVQAHGQAQQFVSRSLPHSRRIVPGPVGRKPLEPLFTQERDETTGHGAQDGRTFRAADDHLEPLHPASPDRHHEASARLELFVERSRQLRCRRGDRNRVEG
jgi:hypothetical protein